MSTDATKNITTSTGLNDMYFYKDLTVDKLHHEYEVTILGKYIKQQIAIELQKISQTAKIPGFRIGKAPHEIIAKNYQNEALDRILSNMVDQCSNDLIQKIQVNSHLYPKIDVVSLPNLAAEDEKSNLIYKLSFELMPESPLIELDQISLNKFEVNVEKEDIEDFIDSIKDKFPDFVSIDDYSYEAKKDDTLSIDFEGRIKGKLFRGGSSKNFSIKIGSNTFINGFEDQLIGMKKNESKSFSLKFPDDYQISFAAGQEVNFLVKVNDIKIIKPFASDNDMAKHIGFDNYQSLVDFAKKALSDQCSKMSELLIKKQLFDHLDVTYNFDLSDNVVDQEEERIKEDLNSTNESRQEAKRRVKLAMLFMKFSTEHKIVINEKDIYTIITSNYVNKDTPINKVINHYKSDEQFQNLIKGQALEHKVTDYILEKVNKESQIIPIKQLRQLFDNI